MPSGTWDQRGKDDISNKNLNLTCFKTSKYLPGMSEKESSGFYDSLGLLKDD